MMSKITSCSKFKEYYVQYYNEMLTSSTSKSKMFWKVINNEIGHVSNKKFTQTEFRNGNETRNIKKSAKSFNIYLINSVDELIMQHPKNESTTLSLRAAFPCDFPQIINVPITAAEEIYSTF
jgi:hypothetical protein